MSAKRRSADLAAAAGLAVLASLVELLPVHGWLQALLVGPLVLVLPGYALAAALFPPGTVSRGERLVHTFVLSIAAVAIGGVLLQLAFDLHRTVFTLLELSVTLAAAGVAVMRRSRLPIQPEARPAPRVGRQSLPLALGYLAAAAIAVVAVASASQGVREQQSRQVFASLWAVPDRAEPARVRVGVVDHGGPTSFRLEVSGPEGPLAQIPVRLGEGTTWEETLPPAVGAGAENLVLTLFQGRTPYRSVELNIGEAG